MINQYFMKASNSVTGQIVYWVVNYAPDLAGTFAPGGSANLTGISVDKITQLQETTLLSSGDPALLVRDHTNPSDAYLVQLNNYNWVTIPPTPYLPTTLPPATQSIGIAVVRGSADGIVLNPYASLFWNEGSKTWSFGQINADGTAGTALPVSTSNITLSSLAGHGSGFAAINNSGTLSFVSGISPSGSAGGNLSGSYPNPTVISLRNNAVKSGTLGSINDGYVLTWVNSSNQWQAKPAAVGSSFTAGGDLSGTSISQNVIKIHGASVPIAGSLTTSAVLQVSGSSSLTYGLIADANVSASAAIEISKLFSGVGGQIIITSDSNVPQWQTISQDGVLSSNGLLTVVGLQGSPIDSTIAGIGASEDGYVLTWVNAANQWEAKPDVDTSIGGSGVFSPVTMMEQIANNAGYADAFTTVNGSFTGGAPFYIYDTSKIHTCTGVRFYWKGAATTIKASLWQYNQLGSPFAARLTSANGSVSSTPGEYTISFSSAQTLQVGVQYCASVWDTSGTSVTNFGNPTNNQSIIGEIMNTPSFIASSYHGYACPAGNGGGTLRPLSTYANGDTAPINLTSTGFTPVEPVLT